VKEADLGGVGGGDVGEVEVIVKLVVRVVGCCEDTVRSD
jgi:hypothetical protein